MTHVVDIPPDAFKELRRLIDQGDESAACRFIGAYFDGARTRVIEGFEDCVFAVVKGE